METYLVFANGVASRWAGIIWPAAWQSAVLALGLWGLARFLRGAPASLRYWLWMLVPLRLLVMPLLSISLPILPVTSVDGGIQTTYTHILPLAQNAAPQVAKPFSDEITSDTVPPAAERAAPRPGVSWLTYLMVAWCGGVLLQTARMARGWRWMRHIVTEGSTAVDGPPVDAALKAGAMLGLKQLPRIVLTNTNVSPFACGIRRPVVVLPKTIAEDVSGPGLLAVLAHEFAHLRRRDPLLGLVLGVCNTAYFFHPLVHWVRRRILFERERACDDLVLATSRATPGAYANALWTAAQLTRNTQPASNSPALVAESFGELKGRLAALSSGNRPRATLSRPSLAFLITFGAMSLPGFVLTSADSAERVSNAAPQFSTNINDTRHLQLALAANPSDAPRETGPTRVIHFPTARAVGVVSVRSAPALEPYRLGPNYSAVGKWNFLAVARGDVVVPADADVKLFVSGRTLLQDLSALRTLEPNDLGAVEISCPDDIQVDADHEVMPYLAGLTGLKTLHLCLPSLTDRGMRYVKGMTSLEDLSLRALGVTDVGLEYTEGMRSLQALWAWVTVTDQGLAHLGKLSSLRELSVNATSIRGPGLSHLAQLPKLERLELQGADFGNSGLKYLSELHTLRSLWLRGEDLKISDTGMRYVAQLTGLETLDLSRFEGVTDTGVAYLKDLKSLRTLNLGKSVITEKALETICGIESLEELWLPNNLKSPMTDRSLSYLPKLRRLKRLQILGASNGPITDQGLACLGTMSSLRELSVCGGDGITDSGIRRLAALTQLEKFSILTDSHYITDASLAQIGRLRNLKFLYLYCTTYPFTTSGLNEINRLTNLEYLKIAGAKHDQATLDWSALTHLEDLTVEMRSFEDADLESIGTLTSLKRLQGLTDIGNDGLAHLAGLTRLQSLAIGKCKLTDEGLHSLENLKNLELLALSGSFTGPGLESLEGLQGLQSLIITGAAPPSPQVKARLQDRLPNLVLLRVNASAGLAPGYSG